MHSSRNPSVRPGEFRSTLSRQHRQRGQALDQAAELVGTVCRVAGSDRLLGDDNDLETRQLRQAILDHNTPYLFGRLVEAFSLQGISDHVAYSYMNAHGRPTWNELRRATTGGVACAKLRNYWSFHNCGYQKSSLTCDEPELLSLCSLPNHDLRNGRLNQTTHSLFLFMRDVMNGDPVEWIDRALDNVSEINADDHPRQMRNALIGPLRNIFGVSDKVLNMTLADILLAAPSTKPLWLEAGHSMIAVDTLVHNFLHRTGILHSCGTRHSYGPGCYAVNGCADVIGQIATRIVATQFNGAYPKTFPRFVQHAIWRYCAQYGLGICNGNSIDDSARCANRTCPLFRGCARKVLNAAKAHQA